MKDISKLKKGETYRVLKYSAGYDVVFPTNIITFYIVIFYVSYYTH